MTKHVSTGETESVNAPHVVPFPAPTQTRKMLVSKPWLIGAGAALVLAAAIALAWGIWGAGSPVRYASAPVTVGPISRAVISTGTVNPQLTIIVGSYVSGVIQSVSCDYNTTVKRGQICAKIDPRPYQTVVDQAKASLAVARAQLEKDQAQLAYAKIAYDRAAALVRTNAVSKDTVDNAKSAYDQAQAQITFDQATIQQRQAALDAAQVNLDYTNIVSPVDGTVVSRNVTIGQTVAASFQTPTLFLIATDLTRMQVDANVSESDIGGIKDGNKATFTVDAYPKRTFEGALTQVRQSPQMVQNVVTYDVVITVDNSDLALMPGLTAATRIVTDERSGVLRVPNQALRYAPGGRATTARQQTQVWVLRAGQPVAIPVATGLDDDAYSEIVKGDIKQGDRVITGEQRDAANTRSAVPRPRF
jgi:HlyD family secretion protein